MCVEVGEVASETGWFILPDARNSEKLEAPGITQGGEELGGLSVSGAVELQSPPSFWEVRWLPLFGPNEGWEIHFLEKFQKWFLDF